MKTNSYFEKAEIYSKHGIQGTLKLAYSNFDRIFQDHVKEGKSAIDFGCGSGRSTRYLSDYGFITDGVDIDESMIEQAKKIDHEDDNISKQPINYTLLENGKVLSRKSKYDLVFSAFVLIEISKFEDITNYFLEVERIMRFNGTFVALVTSDDFYRHNWVSIDTNYPENQSLSKGSKAKIKLREIDLELDDYYWAKEDYIEAAKISGLSLVECISPKANLTDNSENWIDETRFSPYNIMIFKKDIALTNAKNLSQEKELFHIEGKGYFKEIYRSDKIISNATLGECFSGDRHEESAIELLMDCNCKWPFHKMLSSEKFTYIEGRDLIIHIINSHGEYSKIKIGQDSADSLIEYTIPSNTWFSEEMDISSGITGYSFVKATQYPGFNVDDVQEATRAELLGLVGENQIAIDVINKIYPFEKKIPNKIDIRYSLEEKSVDSTGHENENIEQIKNNAFASIL